MPKEFEELEAQVKASNDVKDSATLLINGFAERLAAAGTDPTKLAALRNDLKSHADSLSAAVVANTPAAEPPSDPPTGEPTDPAAPSSKRR